MLKKSTSTPTKNTVKKGLVKSPISHKRKLAHKCASMKKDEKSIHCIEEADESDKNASDNESCAQVSDFTKSFHYIFTQIYAKIHLTILFRLQGPSLKAFWLLQKKI